MATRVIVLVSDRDDPKHGEVTVLNDARKAERLVETLLEAGFEQERIRIFTGAEMDLQVTHRPVVALVPEDLRDSAAGDDSSADEAAETEDGPVEADAEEEKTPATAFVKDGVRFSSLFRSA